MAIIKILLAQFRKQGGVISLSNTSRNWSAYRGLGRYQDYTTYVFDPKGGLSLVEDIDRSWEENGPNGDKVKKGSGVLPIGRNVVELYRRYELHRDGVTNVEEVGIQLIHIEKSGKFIETGMRSRLPGFKFGRILQNLRMHHTALGGVKKMLKQAAAKLPSNTPLSIIDREWEEATARNTVLQKQARDKNVEGEKLMSIHYLMLLVITETNSQTLLEKFQRALQRGNIQEYFLFSEAEAILRQVFKESSKALRAQFKGR